MKRFLVISSAFVLISCSNRTVGGLKQGYWKQTDTLNGVTYQSKGRYKNGLPVGKWKYKTNGKLTKKEKYKGEDCYVEFFGSTEKLERAGNAKFVREGNDLHWYYVGDWITYDIFGNPIYVDTYYRGELVGEKEIN
ncbi:hypothetical protein [Flavobacterium selenitireducens]|uniref:hypothetical protein n=1 Tax=Flavobacterium selenitireducens TaxID=2722704 RepID=UPI00168B0F70|nr:hypothetical protein [Flavobacterium selenitireducens]MBD3582031.1 hypothetical protein [Flavobacterium selenitireducens]